MNFNNLTPSGAAKNAARQTNRVSSLLELSWSARTVKMFHLISRSPRPPPMQYSMILRKHKQITCQTKTTAQIMRGMMPLVKASINYNFNDLVFFKPQYCYCKLSDRYFFTKQKTEVYHERKRS